MRAVGLSLGLLALLLLPGFCHAQGAANAAYGRLHKVDFTGVKTFSPADVLQASGLKLDSPTTVQDLQNAANKLSALGAFSDVRYRYETTTDGLEAQFQVVEAPEYPVAFDNFPWISDDDLSAAIKKSVALFNGSAPEHGAMLDAMSTAIEDQLTLRSVQAKVSYRLLHNPITDAPTMQFRAEGPPIVIAGVQFSDALAKTDPAITQSLKDIVGKPYSRDTLELFEFEQVRPAYLAHGYLQVHFPRATVQMADRAGKPSSTDVMIAAPIEPGSAFTWSGVVWTGSGAVAPQGLDRLVPFKAGDSADGMKIQALWNAVADAYGHLGYLDAAITPMPYFDEAAKHVTYSVSIVEGPQYHMGDLVLSGLSVVGEKQIRDAWKIPPGAIFDQAFYDTFLDTGIKQAFAGLPIHYEKIGHYLEKNPQTARANVMLDFQ